GHERSPDERNGGAHGGGGDVRRRTGGEEPTVVRDQRIAGEILGRCADGRRVGGQGLKRTRGGKGRGDRRIAHHTGHADDPMLEGEAGGGDGQRAHLLAEG